MLRISENIYNIQGLRIGRVYVIKASDGLTLIDTSLPNSMPQIAKELATIQQSLTDIKRILITHAHYDHIGSLADLKALSGATVYAPRFCESPAIRGDTPMPRADLSQLSGLSKFAATRMKPPVVKPTQVEHEFDEGDQFDEVLPGLVAVATPGHTPGHCSFYQPEQRLLFAGDAIGRIPVNMSMPGSFVTTDPEEAKRSIRKLAQMNIATLCMGHGNPYLGNAGPALHKFASSLN